ncbi:LytR/AlgR family response regulator transcription factor [Fulvivirga lutea]|uniref:LytTR family transcriptional regulator n=1 Tax=Fulvivirga lutea TaxID=2810512 RepID=A0A974WEK5_9BACT|nr:LytTR family DNA-binding domain-containing protein [Fulvivirga lutea]QSE96676.1 LytTR family transcriptional regulator [Fulvivirga lutea]
MNQLANWSCKAYPNDDTLMSRLKRALMFGLFVTLFLAFFKPFGFDSVNGWLLYRICLEFGLITAISIASLSIILPYLFPTFFDSQNWVVWKEVGFTILHFVVIGLANALFLHFRGYKQGDVWEVIIDLQISTLAVGSIPVLFYVYYDQAKYFKKYVAEAKELNKYIDSHKNDQQQSALILFKNEGGDVEYQFPASQLLFIKSDGNYLELFVKTDEKIKKHLLRNRIKNVIEAIPAVFIRCHRSYVVNLDMIRKVDGNARGYELTLEYSDVKVPVSRNMASDVLLAIERSAN